MKKVLLTIVGAAFLAVSFSSCKKTITCEWDLLGTKYTTECTKCSKKERDSFEAACGLSGGTIK